MGHTVIHGRRTHESLKGRHLDGRRIIILSGSLEAVPDNAQALAPGLAEAYRIAAEEFDDTETFVAGGGRVYRHALERELIDRMYLTLVEADVQGDTFFPPYDPSRWEVVHSEHHDQDERHAYPFVFQTLERRPLDEEAE